MPATRGGAGVSDQDWRGSPSNPGPRYLDFSKPNARKNRSGLARLSTLLYRRGSFRVPSVIETRLLLASKPVGFHPCEFHAYS
ncbi:MAG: hypothetical protein JWP89_5687 [Schlesneria sp.]|nr:hypothetical protein [Schlesneria sp.]